MRKLYWYLSTYLKKHGWVLIISIVVALLLFSLLIPSIAKQIELKEREYIGIVGEYSLSSLPQIVRNQLSVGLTKIEPDGTLAPLLAERWIVEDDGATYRFIIKKDILWQDGSKLVPADIEYNFSDVEVITTPNDIVFKLPDTFVPFPSVVSQPILKTSQSRYLLFFERPLPIGIGPYSVIDYKTKGQNLTEMVVNGPDKHYIYRFYRTSDSAILGYKRGEVDVISDLSSTGDIGDWNNTQIEKTIHTNRYLAVFFNNSLAIFSKNIRQALSYATNKPTDESRALGPIDPQSWVYLEGGKSYSYDLVRAVERFLDELPPEPLDIELTTTSAFSSEAEEIKRDWQVFSDRLQQACAESDDIKNKDDCSRASINVTIKVTNFPDTSNFQVLLIGQESTPDPDQYALWHSQQSTNFTKYKNTRIDSLLEKGRTTPEAAERKAIYQEFQQFFLEDAPAIFIRHLESYEVRRK